MYEVNGQTWQNAERVTVGRDYRKAFCITVTAFLN